MCGIVVEIRKNDEAGSFIGSMLDAILHRGKDAVTINLFGNISIGHRRLAITDLDCEPEQGAWKIYLNGEIYNYKELGFEGCEVEVLSQGFERFGVDFVKKLNGMFAIVAINDGNVYCFRDRYGIKPLYYYENEHVLLIASEIKAIAKHPAYTFSINENAKRQWLVFNNYLDHETLFEGVYKLEKGTFWDVANRKTIKYWQWEFKPTPIDYTEAKRKVRQLLINAIKRQIPKEVKYASCLSGGIDSNIVALFLGQVKTFTAGYEGLEDERHMAKLTRTDNETVVFDKVEDFDKTIYHLEDLRVGACWSNYGLYKRGAEQGYKVMFDGAGADELFGGYEWRYKADDYYQVVNRTGAKDRYCEWLFGEYFPNDTLTDRYLFDCNIFLEGVLLSVDKISMAHTIEMRLPYLDNDFVDFCLTLPEEYKVNKKILKDAFSWILPKEILEGKKKGFTSPDWLTGEGNQANKWANAALKEWQKQYGQKFFNP
jgi:asparagine synthase (glutamine-hydrolysing)